MSRRTAESNKAILAAWNTEQELVQEGKGTREWTPEQQQDILEKGKAYDENGKAFEGQHMKSAERYPEYQGEPGNIQFLTRAEHLEAHDGNWRNPTNWYYNPVTREKIDFGEGPFIPCEIIKLKEPVVYLSNNDEILQQQDIVAKLPSEKPVDTSKHKTEDDNKTHIKTEAVISPKSKVPVKSSNTFVRGMKSVGRFIVSHPIESLEIAGIVIGKTVKEISSVRGRSSNNTRGMMSQTGSSSSIPSSIADKVVDIVGKANRALPGENDVAGHRQRYHTKNGVIWKDKVPYHRGSNKG